MRETRQRTLAIVSAVVFLISCVFPVVAAFVKDTRSWPRRWGALDVGIALVLALLVFFVQALSRHKVNQQGEQASYRVYRILLHGIFLMLVIFFLAGERIKWNQCLTGFAWRAWLLFYILPWWFAAFATKSIPDDREGPDGKLSH